MVGVRKIDLYCLGFFVSFPSAFCSARGARWKLSTTTLRNTDCSCAGNLAVMLAAGSITRLVWLPKASHEQLTPSMTCPALVNCAECVEYVLMARYLACQSHLLVEYLLLCSSTKCFPTLPNAPSTPKCSHDWLPDYRSGAFALVPWSDYGYWSLRCCNW